MSLRTAQRMQLLCRASLIAWAATSAVAQTPYGLDTRPAVGAYFNGVLPPTSSAFAFPPVLSATGVFRDLQTLTPSDGLIPFAPNSALWTDGAVKSRWMAVPNDGPPYLPNEQIGFAPVGEWSFPNGTVFVKQFDLIVNEATGQLKRQETRLLVRDANGGVYGVTYKWRPDHSDADLLPGGLEEDVVITGANGATRIQRYSYPSRAECLFCHNKQANYVLGAKTHQLNGDLTYPATGRSDNQLRTLNHLGLLHPPQNEASFATYLRSVAVTDPKATVQHRVRSWIDANCSHCHRPGGFGPGYDGRLYTPLEQQNLVDTYVRFRDLAGSELYQRDNALGEFKMPPIAKNVIHEEAMAAMRQWIASPLRVLSVHLHGDAAHLAVRFNSRIDPATVSPGNFALDRSALVLAAAPGAEPDVVVLTTTPLVQGQQYVLTVSNVQDTAESANTIWPRSLKSFAAQFETISNAGRLANISTRVHVGSGGDVLIGGFIARGGSTKRVMLRALGPTLAGSGIAGVLADPEITLFDSTGAEIGTNDDWQENANRQEIIDTGIAPASPREAVILMQLPSSVAGTAYTVVLRGAGATTGVGLVEIYDLDRAGESELANISSRGSVHTGEGVMIGGLIVGGVDAQRTLVRASGPSLALDGRLTDPVLELYDAHGELLASNDNWRSAQEADIIATTIPPSDDRSLAIVRTLPPAPYTAIVRGVGATTGVALVEVYNIK
jgi:hypothetical protein